MERSIQVSICVFASFLLFASCANTLEKTNTASLATTERNIASGYVVQNYPILQALEAQRSKLSPSAQEWMKKWNGLDLEDSQYVFPELSGSTSINLKVQKIDKKAENGFKSKGSFVPRNSSANHNLEIAYFNLAAILGYDHLIRPAVRYELGPNASAAFKLLIDKEPIKNKNRLENKTRILNAIASGKPLIGCMKAKKPDSANDSTAMADTRAEPNGGPKKDHPIFVSLQASNPLPTSSQTVQLRSGYTGNLLELAREYSILMTLDSLFQQWDRYSGGNVGIMKDGKSEVHFFFTDNGGGDISKTPNWTLNNLKHFSRFDRGVVAKLKELNGFLENPSLGFIGYTNAETFVVDLGLYSELTPAVYIERLKRNLKLLMDHVEKAEARYGKNAYFD